MTSWYKLGGGWVEVSLSFTSCSKQLFRPSLTLHLQQLVKLRLRCYVSKEISSSDWMRALRGNLCIEYFTYLKSKLFCLLNCSLQLMHYFQGYFWQYFDGQNGIKSVWLNKRREAFIKNTASNFLIWFHPTSPVFFTPPLKYETFHTLKASLNINFFKSFPKR